MSSDAPLFDLPEIPVGTTPEEAEEALALIDAGLPEGHRVMTEEQARVLFAHMNRRIADGQEATQERAALFSLLDRHGWTQTDIAAAADLSQQAVSASLSRQSALDLAGDDAPWLVGRLLGIGSYLRDAGLQGTVRSENLTWRMMGGQLPVTPYTVAQLRAAIEKDLRRPGVRKVAREAFDETVALFAVAELPPSLVPTPSVWGRVIRAEARQVLALKKAS